MNLLGNIYSLYSARKKSKETAQELGRWIDRELSKGGLTDDITGESSQQVDNPDEVVSQKGMEYYKRMRTDEQVKAALYVKKFARLSTGWTVVPPEDPTPEEEEAAEFIKWNLNYMGASKILKGIMSALDFGYSIGEKIYTIAEEGPFAGKVILKTIKSKQPDKFVFNIDEYDNVLSLASADEGLGDAEEFPIEKFVHYAYNQEFSNPYGSSDLRGAYNAWWLKHLFQKFWSIYMERFGIPTAKGTYPKWAAAAQKTTLFNALKGIQHKTTVATPEGFDISLLEVQKEKGDVWIKALDALDARICRSILIPTLMGFSTMNFGSYALGRKQFEVFLFVCNELGNEMADEAINPQIVKPLVQYNYNVERVPVFKFNKFTPDNIDRLFKLWMDAVEKNIFTLSENDESYFREVAGMEPSTARLDTGGQDDGREPTETEPDDTEDKGPEEKEKEEGKSSGDSPGDNQ